MSRSDLVLTGGTIVTPLGARVGDLAIVGERISAMGEPGHLVDGAERVIALQPGQIVLPGSIDPHVHCDWPQAHPVTGERMTSAGPEVVSKAALHGGTTTLIDFVASTENDLIDDVRAKEAHWAERSSTDYSFHLILHGRVDHRHIEAIPALIREGYTSFKVFTTTVRPGAQVRWAIDYGSVTDILRATAEHGGLVAAHAEDDDMVMYAYDRYLGAGDVATRFLPEVHDALSETVAIERLLSVSSRVPGARVYIMHVSSRMAVDAVADAKRRGVDVAVETLHQYTLRNRSEYETPEGMRFHNYPSLKEEDDSAALWEAIADGTVDTLATDEVCLPYDVKIAGQRIDTAVGGSASIETRLELLYTEAVVKRGIGLPRFADIISTNAARIFGMYPRKGVLAPGSDADLVVLDTREGRTIRAEELHESDYNPFEGEQVAAWPVLTVLRGRVVVERGELVEDEPGGRRVVRESEPR